MPCRHNKKSLTMSKKCSYSDLLWSAFSNIWTEYGGIRNISLYLVRMQENADQNNSEYGLFSRSVIYKGEDFNALLTNQSKTFLCWYNDPPGGENTVGNQKCLTLKFEWSKTFDCLPHDLIITKLDIYGFKNDALV